MLTKIKCVIAAFALVSGAWAADSPPTGGDDAKSSGTSAEPSRLYVLRSEDVVQIRVYQEDDLTTQARIAKDGTIMVPLLGTVRIGSNTVEQATWILRDLLAKDYLVNPQVSLTIVEYAKRRFTVLGQVQKPGTYDLPANDTLNLLQAIAIGGGYTRIGDPKDITVQRIVEGQNKIFKLNAKKMAEDKTEKPFIILPDDTITVGERWI